MIAFVTCPYHPARCDSASALDVPAGDDAREPGSPVYLPQDVQEFAASRPVWQAQAFSEDVFAMLAQVPGPSRQRACELLDTAANVCGDPAVLVQVARAVAGR